MRHWRWLWNMWNVLSAPERPRAGRKGSGIRKVLTDMQACRKTASSIDQQSEFEQRW